MGRVEEHWNITNIDISIWFNKTREIYLSATRVASILLTTAATSASVERSNSKEYVPNSTKVSVTQTQARYW